MSLTQQPLYDVDKNNFGPRVGFAWDMLNNGKTVVRSGYSLNYDLPNFGTLDAPQTYFNIWNGTRSGFFTQVADGSSPIDIWSTPTDNQTLFNSGNQPEFSVLVFYLYGTRSEYLRADPRCATSPSLTWSK